MGSSKKAAQRPAPLLPGSSSSSDGTSRRDTFSSDSSYTYFNSEWDHKPHDDDKPAPSRKSSSSSKPSSPTANVYTHCGRHSDQWLFSWKRRSSEHDQRR